MSIFFCMCDTKNFRRKHFFQFLWKQFQDVSGPEVPERRYRYPTLDCFSSYCDFAANITHVHKGPILVNVITAVKMFVFSQCCLFVRPSDPILVNVITAVKMFVFSQCCLFVRPSNLKCVMCHHNIDLLHGTCGVVEVIVHVA